MQNVHLAEQKRKNNETYARLTQPQHHTQNSFREHQRIEGYFENRDVPDFIGSDRLLKIDGIYGTIQLGYNPQKGKSFIFANIKTSIFDTAPSRYQRELKEYQMMRQLKTGTPNIAFSSKRRNGGVALLYNIESRPWSAQSITPYLNRANMESLRKTMPFLDRSEEWEQRQVARDEHRRLQAKVREAALERRYSEMASLRAQQREALYTQNLYTSLLIRKDAAARHFFRRMNIAFDLQKQAMFQYYKGRRVGGERDRVESDPIENRKDDEDQNE